MEAVVFDSKSWGLLVLKPTRLENVRVETTFTNTDCLIFNNLLKVPFVAAIPYSLHETDYITKTALTKNLH
jgi:hypothetical protein